TTFLCSNEILIFLKNHLFLRQTATIICQKAIFTQKNSRNPFWFKDSSCIVFLWIFFFFWFCFFFRNQTPKPKQKIKSGTEHHNARKDEHWSYIQRHTAGYNGNGIQHQ